MLATSLIEKIEKTAPLRYAAKWDKSGIQIAAPSKTITHLAVMLDPCLASVRAALELGADFLLAHHPLSLTPCLPDEMNEYREVLKMVLQKDVVLYSAHTSLDANPLGPVRWLAHVLELADTQLIEKTDPETPNIGFGFCGNLPHPLTQKEFANRLKAQGITSWRKTGNWPEKISRVACCPGSGASLARRAFSLGAEIYITGDIKYHQALEIAPYGLTLDVGHFILEEKMMSVWAQTLQLELQGQIRVSFIAGIDPFCYE